MAGLDEKLMGDLRARLARVPDPIAFLEQLFANAPVAFQIYQADGHCLLVNQAFRELFGSEPPPDYNVLRDDVAEARGMRPLILRAFAGETVSTPSFWYDPRDLKSVTVAVGRRVGISVTMFPVGATDGTVPYVGLVAKDLTAEMHERERLEIERARADFLAQASTLLASTLDYEQTLKAVVRLAVPGFADWCFVDIVQDGVARRVEVAHADLTAAPLAERIKRYPARPSSDAATPSTRALAGQSVLVADVTEEILRRFAEDDEHLAAMKATHVRSVIAVPLLARGRTVGTLTFLATRGRRPFSPPDLATAQDLGARAALSIDNSRLYSEARQARASLEHSARATDEFLAMLGHELRNPLAPIVTALSLMQQRAPDQLVREREIIARQTAHLTRLVDDLLDVSRITRGRVTLVRHPLELAVVVEQAVQMSHLLMQQRNQTLAVQVPSGLVVDGDEVRLAQVLANLLINAAKFSDPGGTVTVTGTREGAEVVLRVRDTGVGFPPELLPRLFDVFSQGERSLDRSPGGLGLGLAIVRGLVDLHGGQVSAASDGPGRGSEFVVRLPAASSAAAAHVSHTPAPQARPARILVVDDNEDAAFLLNDWLTSHGHTVRAIGDGESALAAAAEMQPELALIDIGLPGMDGYQLAGRMRDLPGLKHMHLVAVTGYGQDRDRDRSAAAGFDDHLVKPVDLAALEAAITRLVGGRERRGSV